MSYDLGLNHEAEDDKYIKNAIQELESTYHLVLLTDYFEESLILLKVSLILDLEGLIDVGDNFEIFGDRIGNTDLR